MSNIISLKFSGTITRLAGYDFGKDVYEKQVLPNINFSEETISIEFPNQIIKAASSFVQGFFEDLVKRYGYNIVDTKVIILSEHDSLICSIKNNLI